MVAKKCGYGFLDSGGVMKTGDLGGIHLETDEHCKLGEAAAVSAKDVMAE